jgi:hypothetical protein
VDEANLAGHGLAEMPKSPRSSPNPIRVIDVLTYPAVQLLDVTGPVQVFRLCQRSRQCWRRATLPAQSRGARRRKRDSF